MMASSAPASRCSMLATAWRVHGVMSRGARRTRTPEARAKNRGRGGARTEGRRYRGCSAAQLAPPAPESLGHPRVLPASASSARNTTRSGFARNPGGVLRLSARCDCVRACVRRGAAPHLLYLLHDIGKGGHDRPDLIVAQQQHAQVRPGPLLRGLRHLTEPRRAGSSAAPCVCAMQQTRAPRCAAIAP